MTVSILFVDSNAIWHRRLAEALGARRKSVIFEPSGGFLPRRVHREQLSPTTLLIAPQLLRGWASKTAAIGQRQLFSLIVESAEGMSAKPVVVVTSPAYRLLTRLLSGRLPVIYYCADDYRHYEGWGGERVAEAEAEMTARTELSVFVSEALRERAIVEYGLLRERTLVSPNATEPRFLADALDRSAPITPRFSGPVLGILGNVSDRLDLSLIRAVVDLDAVGTLVIAGAVDEATARRNCWLLSHPKIHVTGTLPHESMHLYSRAFDAALIPYAATTLNFHCSPMRLYDHLASGRPIFATDTCDQICRLASPQVTVASASDLLEKIRQCLQSIVGSAFYPPAESLLWSSRAERLDGILVSTVG
jgi:hypothetical protein